MSRDRLVVFPLLITCMSAVVIAIVLIRTDMRQDHNNRLRTLCALYWGAVDGGTEEHRALEETKRLVSVSQLEMLSFCRFYGDQ